MTDFTACTCGSPIEMPIKIKRPAQSLADMDGGEVSPTAALSKPSVPNQQSSGILIDTHGNSESFVQLGFER
ncbi:hypothetical protein GCM10007919_29140 [Rhizobium indigoferae]|nr:hypothetical protein GCM10007919_29140 [Rhizobium indigoferae]